ncbi:unnamed protein product [Amoebophrya sp. A120]|nr:unnamed protein product [Amoebophrya sp. A120]|eukprot:GSA120T00017770001.1
MWGSLFGTAPAEEENRELKEAEAVFANMRSLIGELLSVPGFFPSQVEVEEVMGVLERCLSVPQLAVLLRRVWFDLLDISDEWDLQQQQDWLTHLLLLVEASKENVLNFYAASILYLRLFSELLRQTKASIDVAAATAEVQAGLNAVGSSAGRGGRGNDSSSVTPTTSTSPRDRRREGSANYAGYSNYNQQDPAAYDFNSTGTSPSYNVSPPQDEENNATRSFNSPEQRRSDASSVNDEDGWASWLDKLDQQQQTGGKDAYLPPTTNQNVFRNSDNENYYNQQETSAAGKTSRPLPNQSRERQKETLDLIQEHCRVVQEFADEHQKKLLVQRADLEFTSISDDAASSITIPASAAKAMGIWPERRVDGRTASYVGGALLLPGSWPVAASLVGGMLLYESARKKIQTYKLDQIAQMRLSDEARAKLRDQEVESPVGTSVGSEQRGGSRSSSRPMSPARNKYPGSIQEGVGALKSFAGAKMREQRLSLREDQDEPKSSGVYDSVAAALNSTEEAYRNVKRSLVGSDDLPQTFDRGRPPDSTTKNDNFFSNNSDSLLPNPDELVSQDPTGVNDYSGENYTGWFPPPDKDNLSQATSRAPEAGPLLRLPDPDTHDRKLADHMLTQNEKTVNKQEQSATSSSTFQHGAMKINNLPKNAAQQPDQQNFTLDPDDLLGSCSGAATQATDSRNKHSSPADTQTTGISEQAERFLNPVLRLDRSRASTNDITWANLEVECALKAEALLKTKIYPIRVLNLCETTSTAGDSTLNAGEQQEDHFVDYYGAPQYPEELKISVYDKDDYWETFPLSTVFVFRGREAVLRPEIPANQQDQSHRGGILKLKVFSPGVLLDEPLITITGVIRGDAIVLAVSPTSGEITVQKMDQKQYIDSHLSPRIA